MSGDWGLFTEDYNDDAYQPMSQFLPTSLQDVWDDQPQFVPSSFTPNTPSPRMHSQFPEIGSAPRKSGKPFPFAESAPALSFMEDVEGAIPTAEPEIKQTVKNSKVVYFMVQFHPNRVEIHHWNQDKEIKIGDYVVTEADRGYDIGKVVDRVDRPSQKEIKSSKEIVRLASHHEISQLPLKAERERKAKELCQAKAIELNLPMTITGAEFQFDSKKLTFFYTASSYVDFRNLVRILFRTFGMRIWMVWHDGKAPVRDVLQRIN